MDPKGINGINRLYKEGDILTQGAHKFAPTAKHIQGGMSNEDFYAEFGDELLVLNGLDYSVNNHSPGARYMATGKLDSLAYPTFAALVAACQGPACPLAFLTFGNYSATGNLVAMSRVPVPAVAAEARQRRRGRGQRAVALSRPLRPRPHRAGAAGPDRGPRRRSRACRGPSTPRTCSTRPRPTRRRCSGSRRTFPQTIPKERLSQQAEIALASFKAGVCVSANLTIGQFDSHANNDPDQMKLIPEFLAGIAYLVRRAEELKIRDQLVVIVQSEMGRTPNYNNGNGKDHWSIGSIMFLGRGIKGNRVIGATDEKQFHVPLDPQTLALRPGEGHPRPPRAHPHRAARVRRHRRPPLQPEVPPRRGRQRASARTLGLMRVAHRYANTSMMRLPR